MMSCKDAHTALIHRNVYLVEMVILKIHQQVYANHAVLLMDVSYVQIKLYVNTARPTTT